MRISKLFKLGVTQHELDFVDIDPTKDKRLFIDPHFLAHRQDRFSQTATRTLRSFFRQFIDLVRAGHREAARDLFDYLHEPNETCLGLSKGRPKGSGVSTGLAAQLFESLSESKAVETGLLEHLEDVRLFIPGIDKDKTSDMVTNIIRMQLLMYTRSQCRFWGIPLTPGTDCGFYWDRRVRAWRSELGDSFVHKGRRILLVPKGIVSYSKAYTAGRFHRHQLLPFKQHEHLRMQTALVQRTYNKKGELTREFVTKDSIIAAGEAPTDKDFLAGFAFPATETYSKPSGAQRARRPNPYPLRNSTAPQISRVLRLDWRRILRRSRREKKVQTSTTRRWSGYWRSSAIPTSSGRT